MALFEDLARERPRDARPLVGLARSHIDEMGGPVLRRYLDRARSLDHRDLRYYELAIGTAFTRLMPLLQELAGNPNMSEEQILARVVAPLATLRGDIEGLARFAPERAAVLRVLVDGVIALASARPRGDPAMRAALAGAWRASLEVRRRYPAEPDTHRLVYLLTSFGSAPDTEVEAAVLAPVPADLPSRDAVLEARAIVYQHILVARVLLDRVPELERVVADIPAARATSWEARNLRADFAALAALAGRGGWDAAAAAYRALLPLAPDGPERARIENNIGVALHRGGHPSEALAAWDRAMRLGPAYPVPDLNHAAAGDGAPYGLERLTDLAGSAELAGIRFQAAAWRRHFGIARGEADQKTIAALREENLDSSLGMLVADGGLGIITAGSFKVSFGYHSTKRLVTELGTESRTWLCLPAPGTAPVKAAARRRP
jgi:tetratricopeptide (TPR) repeat protein